LVMDANVSDFSMFYFPFFKTTFGASVLTAATLQYKFYKRNILYNRFDKEVELSQRNSVGKDFLSDLTAHFSPSSPTSTRKPVPFFDGSTVTGEKSNQPLPSVQVVQELPEVKQEPEPLSLDEIQAKINGYELPEAIIDGRKKTQALESFERHN